MKKTPRNLPADWTTSTEFTANGRHLEVGTEFSVRGEPGRFRFYRHVALPDGREWVDCIGGTRHVRMFRSFRPERVKTVHRLKKTQTPTEAQALVNEKNRVKRGEGATA